MYHASLCDSCCIMHDMLPPAHAFEASVFLTLWERLNVGKAVVWSTERGVAALSSAASAEHAMHLLERSS